MAAGETECVTAMSTTERGADFSATDLKDELRPPELFDETAFRVRPDADDEHGRLPDPVLDPLHGRILTPAPHLAIVETDRDIYHELVEWLDEVFEIPRGYNVHWVDLDYTHGETDVDPHAIIVLRDDDETYAGGVDESVPIRHCYERGSHAGDIIHGSIRDGGVAYDGVVYDSPSKATEAADAAHRGVDRSGYNGWTWWEYNGDGGNLAFTLDYLR